MYTTAVLVCSNVETGITTHISTHACSVCKGRSCMCLRRHVHIKLEIILKLKWNKFAVHYKITLIRTTGY